MAESPEENQKQRLKAAVHYTVGCLCQDVADEKDIQFSKQAVAAISEITFRQFETFAKDLELFARHAKRTTITMDDVKLLARRSRPLYEHICERSEGIVSTNHELKERKKSLAVGRGHRSSSGAPKDPSMDCQTARKKLPEPHMNKMFLPMSFFLLLLVTSRTLQAAAVTRQDKLTVSEGKDMSEVRKNAFLAALSAIFDWTSSQEDDIPTTNREEVDMQYRPQRSTFIHPSGKERSTCKNFFWKTFSTC
ncbi:centromere protein S [Pelobates fuscus]|uniref:centromere protein S n=1 Tax=Pelobates fuscus TaxID=191477 RepID=UPI002FE48B31